MSGAATRDLSGVTLLERLTIRARPGRLELRLEVLGALPGVPGMRWFAVEGTALPLMPGQPLPRPGDRLIRAMARFLRRHSLDGELLAAIDRVLRQPPEAGA